MLAAVAVAAVALSLVFRLWPSVLRPVVWKNTPGPASMDGGFAPNIALQHVRTIEGPFSGPESIEFDPDTGVAYTGFSDGSIGSFSADGQFLGRVLFIGEHVGEGPLSAAIENSELFKWCRAEASAKRLAWNPEGERRCGRPLGLRVRRDPAANESVLFIMDAYHGLFALSLATRELRHLVTPQTPITSPLPAHAVDPDALKAARFFNDLDVLSDGRVVFTDSSHALTRSENRQEVLDGAPRGRLLVFDPRSRGVQALLCGLHFPNGVQSTSAHSHEVIVAEMTRFRLLKVDVNHAFLAGEKLVADGGENDGVPLHHLQACGEVNSSLSKALAARDFGRTGVTLFSDRVPGLADNVRRLSADEDPRQYFAVGMGSKAARPFSLLHVAYGSLFLRDLIGRFVPMRHVERLVPEYGLVGVYDESGECVGSLHDPSGHAARMVSQATRAPAVAGGALWLGSHSESVAVLAWEHVPEALRALLRQ